MKYTPGPWTVHINYTGANFTIFDADGNYAKTDGDTLEANAALIKAAPELLVALEEISRGAGAYSRDPLIHASNCIDEMKAIAKAAIAKALPSGVVL